MCSLCSSEEQPATQAAQCKTKSPKIKNVLNLGEIQQESPIIVQTFVWTNRTNHTLEIAKIVKSCGCATVTAAKMKICPREQTKFKVIIDTTEWTGNAGFTFVVLFKDENIQPEYFKMTFYKPSRLRSDPKQLEFGTLNRPIKTTRKFTVTWAHNSQSQKMVMDDPNIYYENSSVRCKLVKYTQKKERLPNAEKETHIQAFLFQVSIADGTLPGDINDVIHLPVTINGKRNEIKVPVKGRLNPEILPRPSKIFGVVHKDKISGTHLVVDLMGAARLSVEDLEVKIKCEDPRLSFDIISPQSLDNKTDFLKRIALSLKASTSPGIIQTKILLTVKTRGVPFVTEVPVKLILLPN